MHNFKLCAPYLYNHSSWGNLHNSHYRHFGLLCGNRQNSLVYGNKQTKGDINRSDTSIIINLLKKVMDAGMTEKPLH